MFQFISACYSEKWHTCYLQVFLLQNLFTVPLQHYRFNNTWSISLWKLQLGEIQVFVSSLHVFMRYHRFSQIVTPEDSSGIPGNLRKATLNILERILKFPNELLKAVWIKKIQPTVCWYYLKFHSVMILKWTFLKCATKIPQIFPLNLFRFFSCCECFGKFFSMIFFKKSSRYPSKYASSSSQNI